MATYLLATTPVPGHVLPMLTIARDLVGRGHDVHLLSGAAFAESAAAAGVTHISPPVAADYDDRGPDVAFPGRSGKRGVAKLRFDIDNVFINTMPYQAEALDGALARSGADAVLVESAFLGAVPLMLRPREQRPPVLSCGVIPLTVSSQDTAPFGLALQPSATVLGRLRNRALNLLTQRVVFAGNQRHFQQVLREIGAPPSPRFFLDSVPWLTDHYLQLTCPSFEYPRRDMPPQLSFAGPVLPASDPAAALPDWWPELQDRPVVHVTQGTIDTADLDRLVGPALRGLAGEPVLVVVSTGGRPVADVPSPVPANARVAEHLPYDRLLPRTDVMVTNGGYGGVQYALTHGVPLVVGGGTEDKPEVAARVRWAGAGIDLRSGTPEPEAIRRAVRTVLDSPSYRERARQLGAEFSGYHALDTIADALDRAARTPATRQG
jgi:MGT family glycosyltransferase